jgi:hypothetical protein
MEPKEIIIPLTEWPNFYKWPSLSGMRNRYRDRKKFGYERAFFKEGKRVLVRVNVFFECIQQRGNK